MTSPRANLIPLSITNINSFINNFANLKQAMSPPHALLIPSPAQGHVIPFLELSYCLADRGFDVTFVNTEFTHNRVFHAKGSSEMGRIRLVSIPDGLGPDEDRNDIGRLSEGLQKTLPGCLEDLIRKTNEARENSITCMIVDWSLASLLEVAKKMGLRLAAFFPASAAILATLLSVPKFIEDMIIDENGVAMKDEMFQLSPGMPPMNTAHFPWNLQADARTRQIIFRKILNNSRAINIVEFVICNTFHEIEQPVFSYIQKIIPVGPLLTGHRFDKPVGHFWPEDPSCTAWLDKQPANSVVYVAFGSFTVFEQRQFQELALGFEQTGRRFIWVVRPDLMDGANHTYPVGFVERVDGRGRMVSWAPQQRVLAHPSIACFLTHCGWNSTMEGVRNGVPFLCWPYFADQFLNETYICDIWKIGLKMTKDDDGIISKEQIKTKLEELLSNDKMKERAMALKNMAERSIIEGGSSYKNLNNFIDAMK